MLHSRLHGDILWIENYEKQIKDDFILNTKSKLIESIVRKHKKIATPIPCNMTHEGADFVYASLHLLKNVAHARFRIPDMVLLISQIKNSGKHSNRFIAAVRGSA